MRSTRPRSSTTALRHSSRTTPASGILSASSKNAPSLAMGWSRYRLSRSIASITGR
ncbi:hypothetical protein ACFXCZ_03680 [Streptomyces sp. NPDC059396]|uniref:hypothetical protein n=1 Tax=Streptomyces sp. NPDC059396 TaxID=3346819 RepID=UPI0036994175